ncbi:GNAT family N-acetyltransferase [Chengkuizengella sediminis]|uniref:GNAT family N-acetyltransferase n=1 Tax=Chengkuizengella sediminis TaxID=1885917 RepID=UPI001389A9D5|nr:GNAT family N-acetyltransferase [Chengkuizengella sediminis]NDI34432.1 GNAT family N-acetyltransferase [Chengkuizengella sediminis]
MEEVVIIPYGSKYKNDTVLLWFAAHCDAYPYIYPKYRYQEFMHYFEEVILKENKIYLALMEQKVTGFIAFNNPVITQLFISLNHQKSGLGTKLLQYIQSISSGYLELYTFQRNLNARAFYKKHQFKETEFGLSEAENNEPDVKLAWFSET